MAHSFIQSIVKGVHSFCPNNKYSSVLPTSGSQDIALHSAEASEVLYTYQYIYGQTPPPLGEVINILDEDDRQQKRIKNVYGSQNSDDLSDIPNNESHDSEKDKLCCEKIKKMFALQTLIVTVSAAFVVALVVGFFTGYCCGRRCTKGN